MRLLNTRTGEFKWVEDPQREHYAVLSHVWAKPEDPDYEPEQTYQDLLELQKDRLKPNTLPSGLSDKLCRFCETALKDGFELGWADTCCIDKTSSSELSEAINSMYGWYAYSGVCYAFLRDVKSPSEDHDWQAMFQESKWFRRGWTLQELIASRIVIFTCKAAGQAGGWEVLGSKHGLASRISSVTHIDIGVLTFNEKLEDIPIARRMAWMQFRETRRLEDEAYCLMGIFGVNMQTNYGEGRYAFLRLQEKILLQSPDQTIFAWGRFVDIPSLTLIHPSSPSATPAVHPPPDLGHNPIAPASFPKQYLLASSPKDFDPIRSTHMVSLSQEAFQQQLGIPGPHIRGDLYQIYDFTPYGLRTHFPLLRVRSSNNLPTTATHCAILSCEDSRSEKGLLALLLRPRRHLTGNDFFAGAIITAHIGQQAPSDEPFGRDPVWDNYCRLIYITQDQLKSLRESASTSPTPTPVLPFDVSSVYIPHVPSRSAIEMDRDSGVHAVLREMTEQFEVYFCPWAKEVLERDGYCVSCGSQDASWHTKPFANSQSILHRIPSIRRENAIIISNSNSSIDLIVQVGRCSCDFGQHRNFLGVLVSSPDPGSLDAGIFSSPSPDHLMGHCVHVRSWSFGHGFASRQIDFDAPNDDRKLSLRLTLTSLASGSGNAASIRRYRLGAELRELEESELQYPRRSHPLNPSSRSPSQPSTSSPSDQHLQPLASAPLPNNEKPSPVSEPNDSKTTPNDGKYHVDKDHAHTVGLMALCGVLAVVLFSLGRPSAR